MGTSVSFGTDYGNFGVIWNLLRELPCHLGLSVGMFVSFEIDCGNFHVIWN